MAARVIPKAATGKSGAAVWPRSPRQGRRQAPRTTAPVTTRTQATPAAGIAPKARTAREAPAYWEIALTTKSTTRGAEVPARTVVESGSGTLALSFTWAGPR